jgi:enterochelin esterase-like enzyme
MIARFFFALLLAALPATSFGKVDAGTLVDLGVVQSRYADARRVTVWLPSSYSAKGPRHAVLYMHDGQNLFDPETGYGGSEWNVDETLDRLVREKQVRPTIVVAIWNTPKRLQEYVPAKPFAHLPPEYMDRVRGSTAAIRFRITI